VQVHAVTVPSQRLALPGAMLSQDVNLGHVPWATHFAVVVDMGEQRTGGYAVSVAHVAVDPAQNRVQVQVRVTRPGPGTMVLQALTRPYAVALVPRAGLSGQVEVAAVDERGQALGVTRVRLG
jgi:hypothetical protein